MLYDVFGGSPSGSEIQRRLVDPAPTFRNSTKGMLQIVDAADVWDYLNIHSLGDYTEIEPTIAWLRGQLAARELDRPIWIDERVPDIAHGDPPTSHDRMADVRTGRSGRRGA